MKNNKKLVVLAGAAALGLVAATGITSGFAWFATNNTKNQVGLAQSHLMSSGLSATDDGLPL